MFSYQVSYAYDVIIDGIAYNLSGNSAMVTSGGEYTGSLTIPPKINVDGHVYNVRAVEWAAFGGSTIEELVFSEGMEYLSWGLFMGVIEANETLLRVVLPRSIRYLSPGAFARCNRLEEVDTYSLNKFPYNLGLKYVYRGDIDEIPSGFFAGSTIQEFHMKGKVNKIGQSAFSNTNRLCKITLSDNLKEIGDGAFSMSNLSSITLTDSINIIQPVAFASSKLTSVIVSDNFSPSIIKDSAFDNTPFYSLVSKQAIADIFYLGKVAYLFKGNANSVDIKENTLTIADNCFSKCSLSQIKIPTSVRNIGSNAFNASAASIEIAGILDYIGEYAFSFCKGLKQIPELSENAYIGRRAFSGCGWWHTDEPVYLGDRLLYWPPTMPDVVIKEGTREICPWSFDVNLLSSITLPQSLRIIRDEAFCCQIRAIEIPDSVFSIGNGAFRACKSLEYVHLPNSLTELSDNLFNGCSNLSEIHIPKNVKRIGKSAFEGCENLKKVSGADQLQLVDKAAFFNCRNLSDFQFETTKICTIEDQAFKNCSLESIGFPSDMIKLGELSFSGNNIKEIKITSNSYSYGNRAFDSLNKIIYNIFDCKEVKTSEPTICGQMDILKCDTIPVSSEIIEFNAIRATNNLTVELSKNVRFIDVNAIFNDESYNVDTLTIICDNIIPPLTTGSCLGSVISYKDVVELRIPAEAYHLYKSTPGWSDFKNIVDLDGQAIAQNVLITELNLDPQLINGTINSQYHISPLITPNNATNKIIEWSSSNDSVATVDNNGVVTIIAGGECEIIAFTTDGSNVSARCKIYVNPCLAESIRISESKLDCFVGDTLQLVATIDPESVTDKTVTWSSSDPNVAYVNNDGLVTALKEGTAIITATTSNELTTSCEVRVNPILVESIILKPYEIQGLIGESFTIKATVLPENASEPEIEWESNNPMIATVNQAGDVEILKEGSCRIIAHSIDGSNVSAECIITGTSGIESTFANCSHHISVYTPGGILVKKDCSSDDLKKLGPGIYILKSESMTITVILR